MEASSDKVTVGVIGVGEMGATHAENLHTQIAGARLGGVADADSKRAEEIAARCGGATIFDDGLELIENDGIDVVVIASPDKTHAHLTMECLIRGKSVLCEKPLATSADDAREVVEAEIELGRKQVQIGFMRRYDPQHLGVRNAVADGTIGRPVLFKGWHRDLELPTGATSEFVVFSSTVHDLDSVRWLLGQEIEEVYVRGVNTESALGDDVWDLQLVQLSLSGGCLGTIEVYTTAKYGYEVGVELVGERGAVHIAPASSTVVYQERNRFQRIEGHWLDRFRTAYVTEMEQWIRSIADRRPSGPDAWDGYIGIIAAEGCVASLRSGLPQRLPVPERPALYRDNLVASG
jgi:myo-inositol 2-dehydrogenase / D-chiro-inositol 1-dehydrogenase